jgi:hypothetical protein
LIFKSKWDTLSVLNIENEKYFVSKNRVAAPLIKNINKRVFSSIFQTPCNVAYEVIKPFYPKTK